MGAIEPFETRRPLKQPGLPAWVQQLIDAADVEVEPVGTFQGHTIWACLGDCSCWFVIDEDRRLDRYSFVNEQGWCQGQHCPCHALPAERPAQEAT